MKKILMLLSFVLILCIILVSCSSEYPSTSDNFDADFRRSFPEKYSVKDPHLLFMTASPYEAKMEDNILLSVIDGVDKNMFVAGAQLSYFMGKSYEKVYVYQTEDAPTPMKDWTIKNIYLIKSSGNYQYTGDGSNGRINVMQRHLERSEILKLYTRYDESEARFIESMKESYLYAINRPGAASVSPRLGSHQLLFTFEECPNIVWISDLWWANGYFFIEVNTVESSEPPLYYGDDRRTFGLIKEEFGEMIRQALISGGWVEPEHIPGLLPPTFPQMFQ